MRKLADGEAQTALLEDDATIFLAAFQDNEPVGFVLGTLPGDTVLRRFCSSTSSTSLRSTVARASPRVDDRAHGELHGRAASRWVRPHRARQRSGETLLIGRARRAGRDGDAGLSLHGRLTVVRPATDDDADLLVAWHADPQVSRYWDGETFTRRRYPHACTASRSMRGSSRRAASRWATCRRGREDDEPWRGGLDGFLTPGARGRGLMPDAARALAQSLHDAGWQYVTVDPDVWNDAAIRAWAKAGFVEVLPHR